MVIIAELIYGENPVEYRDQFDLDFMARTLELVKQYKGPNDATLLLNCLVGLLIVPREKYINKIPQDPISALHNWGISPKSIKTFGFHKDKDGTKTGPREENLRNLVKSLRNAVAHGRFEPQHRQRVVTGFKYTDNSGFEASIGINEMKNSVEILARRLEREIVG
jgi:hypothetical protein